MSTLKAKILLWLFWLHVKLQARWFPIFRVIAIEIDEERFDVAEMLLHRARDIFGDGYPAITSLETSLYFSRPEHSK